MNIPQSFQTPPSIEIAGDSKYSTLQETGGWESLYNDDGTAKINKGQSYPFVSKNKLDKRYKSSTDPNWMRTSIFAREPYVWTQMGGDIFNWATRGIPLMRSVKDVVRLGKYMTSMDGVLNFIGIGQNLPGLLSQVEYREGNELKVGPHAYTRSEFSNSSFIGIKAETKSLTQSSVL